jgi:hypothetical protein
MDYVNSEGTYYLCDNVSYLTLSMFQNKGWQAQKDRCGFSDVAVKRQSKQTNKKRMK